MKTIVEPKEHIDKLWGKQKVQEDAVYRLMRYVLRVDHDGKVLLHNVVTGRLVVLDQAEAEVLEKLPMAYNPVMEQLVAEHYLVPDDYDEHQQVKNLRMILRKLDAVQQRNDIRHYIILPTTACNARCYYCFEQGVEIATMTEEIADDVVEFIAKHCGENKKVSIMWFGGEPTVAANRIEQISEGLRKKGIIFTSTMVSNAYLFDEDMVEKAKNSWNLKRVQISVDGTEQNYNEVKNYVYSQENPYERVMRNIGLLLKNGIQVDLRMNFDLNNYQDFEQLIDEAIDRFKGSRFLQVYAYPVIGAYPDKTGKIVHGDDEWRAKVVVDLNDKARKAGLYRLKDELPSLQHAGCGADTNHSITINAKGYLVECPEHIGEDEKVGTVKEGIKEFKHVQAWKQIADIAKCTECVFFPRCLRLQKCSAGDSCYYQDRNHQYIEAVKLKHSAWADSNMV